MAKMGDKKDVVFIEDAQLEFKIEGKKGASYEVSVIGNQITIKKLSTGNIKTGTYEIVEINTFLNNEEFVRKPVITLDLEPDRHIGSSILEKIKELLEEKLSVKYNVVEYVQKNYPEEWAAINKDPIKWVLKKTGRYFIGGEKYKIALLHSLVSSRTKKRKMRINLLFVGESGVGKSTLVRSIMELLPESNWIHYFSELTPEVLTYMDLKNIDGHIFWIEELDDVAYLRAMKEILTGWNIGIPLFISTAIDLKKWGIEAEQILSKMFVLFFKQDIRKSIRYTLMSEKGEYPEAWKLVFYAWLWTRRAAKLKEEAKKAIVEDLRKIAKKAKGAIFRMALLYKQLTIAHAMIYGREEATLEDYQFVKENFAPDLYLNGLLLDERDIAIMKAIKELGGAKVSEIVIKTNRTRSEAARMLRILAERGVVDYNIINDRKIYRLTPFGEEILGLFEAEADKDEEEQKGSAF